MTTTSCAHDEVICLNEYETIRKYRCTACNGVMMCACDEERGKRFLPHQLGYAAELKTQKRVPVTHGFQKGACRECRGLPPIPSPKAAIPGRTSKIKRFYWRELDFREFEILEKRGTSLDDFLADPTLRKEIGEQALNDIQVLHERRPKYSLDTESEASFLARIKPQIVEVRARARTGGEVLRDGGSFGRPEVFGADWLSKSGFSSMECESTPLHALFAVLLWPLIQDCSDPLLRHVTFGERSSFEEHRRSTEQVFTALPQDFGTAGYAQRRADEIDVFFEHRLPKERDQLLLSFDMGLEGSYELRQYLWAHKERDALRARRLLGAMPLALIRRTLRYLLQDYWHHYLGWPDIFAWRGADFLFLEVKLSSNKLSDEQRVWIEHNATTLQFPFKILKIHKIPEKMG